VFFVVDVLRRLILLLIDGLLIRIGQLAAVCLTHPAHFGIDALLLIFQLRRFTRSELSALYTLCNAILLVFTALSHFIIAVMLGVGIVLVVVNLVRQ